MLALGLSVVKPDRQGISPLFPRKVEYFSSRTYCNGGNE
jgi:hypothetical protein